MNKEKTNSIKTRIKNFGKKIWHECKDKQTVCIFLIVVVVVYAPVWLDYILYWIFRYKTFLVVATACLAFWAGPGTPFFPLCIAITLGIKKLLRRKEAKQTQEKQHEAMETEQMQPETVKSEEKQHETMETEQMQPEIAKTE